MKQYKKLLVMLLCVGTLSSLTACGNKEDADNGAVNNEATDNTENRDDNMNGATDGTDETGDKKDDKEDSVGGALEEGAEDVGDALDGDDTKNDNDTKTDR